MKLIAGLGNPGKKFDQTRHNIGFDVIDAICHQEKVKLSKKKFNAAYEKCQIQNEEVLLVKPLTFMNLSGEAIAPLLKFYKIPLDDVMVIYDDLDLPAGKIRLRNKGSAGGHNGLKSTIAHLGTQDFKRMRIGIGRPEGRQPVMDYVLKPFSREQRETMDQTIVDAADACIEWLDTPFANVMNRYNR